MIQKETKIDKINKYTDRIKFILRNKYPRLINIYKSNR